MTCQVITSGGSVEMYDNAIDAILPQHAIPGSIVFVNTTDSDDNRVTVTYVRDKCGWILIDQPDKIDDDISLNQITW